MGTKLLLFDGFAGQPFDDFYGRQYDFTKCGLLPGVSDACLLFARVPLPPSVFLIKDHQDERYIKLVLQHAPFLDNVHILVVRQIGLKYQCSVSEMILLCDRCGAYFREIDVHNEDHRRQLTEYASMILQ